MNIAIPTFDGFNELDSLIALGIPQPRQARRAGIVRPCPPGAGGHLDERRHGTPRRRWKIAANAAVIIGSGMKTRDVAQPIRR